MGGAPTPRGGAMGAPQPRQPPPSAASSMLLLSPFFSLSSLLHPCCFLSLFLPLPLSPSHLTFLSFLPSRHLSHPLTFLSSLLRSHTHPGRPQCKALYDFDAENPDELTFRVGDIIDVVEEMGEWWKGEYNGQQGIFPANYVEKIKSAVSVVSVFFYEGVKVK